MVSVHRMDSTLTVTTTGVYKFYLPVSLRFVWPPPMISSTSEKLEFPLLSLGNSSVGRPDVFLALFL